MVVQQVPVMENFHVERSAAILTLIFQQKLLQ